MRIYKSKFKDKNGKVKKCRCYCIDFTDNQKVRRRLPAFTSKTESIFASLKLADLLSANGNNRELTEELQDWIVGLPDKIRNKLIEFGLVKNQRLIENTNISLAEHLTDFALSLENTGRKRQYVKQTESGLRFIFGECDFKFYRDVDGERLLGFLASRMSDEGIGQRSFNCYLKTAQQFCRWMIKARRAEKNPLAYLSSITQTEKRRQRRALTPDEQTELLKATAAAPLRFHLTGYERSLIYRLALLTGLRVNEIKTLTVSAFDFKQGIVTALAGYTKNKQTAELNLMQSLADELKTYLAGKLPNTRAFKMPNKAADMIKADLKAAGIPYETDKGYADFHSLRHTFITNLVRQGVYPKDVQMLARHSTIALTLDLYTHVPRENLRRIVDAQIDPITRKEQDKKIS